jgi:gluconokinase
VQRRLLGDAAASISMASGTGLLDQRTCTWDEELTRGIADRLPPIDDTPRSGLTPEWAERWPGLRDVPWFPAWGDGACSNLGSGCGTLERAALMVGTSGALRVLWRTDEVPEITRGLWRYRADAERVVIGGSLSDGGSVVAWLRRLTRLPEDLAEAERAIAAMEPDAHGLTVLPLLSGERGPGWSDAAGATVAGLTPATEPRDLLRASLEAVALRFRLIELELSEALPGERAVVGTGGGLVNSPAWTQIMADALGRPVALSEVDEGSSRGAALLALEALGHVERAEDVEAPLGETFAPDPNRTQAYRGALERQVALYDAVTSMPAPQPPAGPAPAR